MSFDPRYPIYVGTSNKVLDRITANNTFDLSSKTEKAFFSTSMGKAEREARLHHHQPHHRFARHRKTGVVFKLDTQALMKEHELVVVDEVVTSVTTIHLVHLADFIIGSYEISVTITDSEDDYDLYTDE